MSDLHELLQKPPRYDFDPNGDPEDPELSLGWLLRMAERTRDAQPESVDRAVHDRLLARLRARPGRDEALGQLHIDAASCIRRAHRVGREGPLLAVGDDDAVALAWQELGYTDVSAVDLDGRLLDFLAAEGVRTERVNVLEQAVPPALRRHCSAVVTDPFRDLDGGLGFLCFAAACVRDGGALFWVDDPMWNPEHASVVDAMARLGWHIVETHADLHAYPLTRDSFDPEEIVAKLDVDAAWIDAVIAETSAWSSLYRLERA